MPQNILHSAQSDSGYTGKLQIDVTSSLGLIPIQDATVTISYTGIPDVTIEKITTAALLGIQYSGGGSRL